MGKRKDNSRRQSEFLLVMFSLRRKAYFTNTQCAINHRELELSCTHSEQQWGLILQGYDSWSHGGKVTSTWFILIQGCISWQMCLQYWIATCKILVPSLAKRNMKIMWVTFSLFSHMVRLLNPFSKCFDPGLNASQGTFMAEQTRHSYTMTLPKTLLCSTHSTP
jgi:hypothetical protein